MARAGKGQETYHSSLSILFLPSHRSQHPDQAMENSGTILDRFSYLSTLEKLEAETYIDREKQAFLLQFLV